MVGRSVGRCRWEMMAPIYLEMSTQDAQTLFCPTTEMGREDEPCESGRASEIDRYVVAALRCAALRGAAWVGFRLLALSGLRRRTRTNQPVGVGLDGEEEAKKGEKDG